MTDRHRAGAAMATTLLLWSSAFVAIRIAVADFTPAALTLARLVVASLALAAAAPLLGLRRCASADIPRLTACGLAGMTGYQLLLNAGERTVDAGTASLLIKSGPVFAALLAWLLLGSRPTRLVWAGIALGFTGASLIALSHHGPGDVSVDALLVLGAALSQATFFVLQKPLLGRYTAFEVTCYATWTATALALPAVLPLAHELPRASAHAMASVAFLGIGSSAVGFATWSYALARVSVAAAASTLYLTPPFAIGISWALLHEAPRPLSILGGLIVVIAVAVTHHRPRRRHSPDLRDRLHVRSNGPSR